MASELSRDSGSSLSDVLPFSGQAPPLPSPFLEGISELSPLPPFKSVNPVPLANLLLLCLVAVAMDTLSTIVPQVHHYTVHWISSYFFSGDSPSKKLMEGLPPPPSHLYYCSIKFVSLYFFYKEMTLFSCLIHKSE